MSLLKTRAIRVGSLIAFTADPTSTNGVSLIWGNPTHMNLGRGDVVQVLSIEVGDGTTWAKVQVLVVRGKGAGRTGHVSIDFSSRLQRCWQSLTPTGSMAPVRAPAKSGVAPKLAPPASGTRLSDDEDELSIEGTLSYSFDIHKAG